MVTVHQTYADGFLQDQPHPSRYGDRPMYVIQPHGFVSMYPHLHNMDKEKMFHAFVVFWAVATPSKSLINDSNPFGGFLS